MKLSIQSSIALLALLGAATVQASDSAGTAHEICKPSSAIRHQVASKPDTSQVRQAPAHGSCRNTAAPQRAETVTLAAAEPSEEFTVCKANSAIRYRVAGKPDSDFVRTKNSRGSCRNP